MGGGWVVDVGGNWMCVNVNHNVQASHPPPPQTHQQVATRRTRTAGKVEIPNVDDHVSKLEHMGKETVKKLQDLRGAAANMGIELDVPENTINKGACVFGGCCLQCVVCMPTGWCVCVCICSVLYVYVQCVVCMCICVC